MKVHKIKDPKPASTAGPGARSATPMTAFACSNQNCRIIQFVGVQDQILDRCPVCLSEGNLIASW